MIRNLITIVFACLPLFFLTSCQTSDKLTYELRGVLSGVSDGHVLYMTDEFGDINLDSAVVEGNEFYFTGELSISPMIVWITGGASTETDKCIWLEPGEIFIDASNTTLRKGKTTGSKLQEEAELLQVQMENGDDLYLTIIEFIKSNPNSIVSAHALEGIAMNLDKETVENLYDILSDENKESEYGESVLSYLRLNESPTIGDRFVDFEMFNDEGNSKLLSEHLGKLTLLDFWASSCIPCRMEHPNLVNAYETFHDKGFHIVSVSQDTKKHKWLDAIKQDGVGEWLHLSDLSRSCKAGLIYGVTFIPANYLIDEDGIIIAMNLKGEALGAKLEELLENEKL